MIAIFFVPGMFGTTLEYMLRNYTLEHSAVEGFITDDGSMHNFRKEYHPGNKKEVETYLGEHVSDLIKRIGITTPIYPWPDAKLEWIVNNFPIDLTTSKNIFVWANDFKSAELNMLFQFYKISKGVLNAGLKIFCGDNSHNITNWNSAYTHWSEMKPWELREWLSIFYPIWILEWITPTSTVAHIEKLTVNNVDLLSNLEDEFLRIAKYCNLTVINNASRATFIEEWTNKQQYIVDEYNLINQIVEKTLKNENFEWDGSRLCEISEAIIQQRLRTHGYEIECYGLNTFPTSSRILRNLIESFKF